MYMGFDINDLRGKRREALIGYFKLNMVDRLDGIKWGWVNDHDVRESWLKTLTNNLREHIDNCSDATAMDASVRRAWIKNIEKRRPGVEGDEIDEVAEVEFTDAGHEALASKDFWMLSGNHRQLALNTVVGELENILERYKEELERAKKREMKDPTYESHMEVASSTKLIEELEARIAKSSMWAVRLYDRGEREWFRKYRGSDRSIWNIKISSRRWEYQRRTPSIA